VGDEADDLAAEMANVVRRDGASVPALFRWEIQNALLLAVRRSRIDARAVDKQLADLEHLRIFVDAVGVTLPYAQGIDLARRFGLSSYDACYLELAVRSGRPLMTRDARLASSARDLGVLWLSRDPSTTLG
jgi:predicted nucleic acid-binding protein